MIHVQQGFNDQVLTKIGETLAEFLQLVETSCTLVKHFNVLTGRQLAFLLDTLFPFIQPNLMRINVRVILSNLANEFLCAILCRLKECLFSLEDLFLDIFRSVDIEHTWQSHKEELFVMGLRCREPDSLKDSINTPLDLAIEAI